MSVISNNQLAGAAGQGGSTFEIQRSLRFNSGDSAYLNRTPSSAGNRKTWTWSGWVKIDGNFANRNTNYGGNIFFSSYDGNPTWISFNVTDPYLQFSFNDGSWRHNRSAAMFRDVSAWYHIVVALDTTQSTGSDRIKMYVNGVRLTEFSTTYTIPQNTELAINNAYAHNLGASSQSTSGAAYDHFGGYLADIHFIDGVSGLSASDFGELDSNNVWQPKKYSGSYGTNGFYLDFSDNSSAAALGNDAAGSNNWTVNNLIATAVNYTSISTLAALSGSSLDSSYNDVSKVFDGSGTGVRTITEGSNQGEKLSITFSPAITLNNETVSIDTSSTYQGMFVTVDGSDGSRVSGSDSNTSTLTTGSLSGSLSKITVDNGTDTSGRPASILRIRIGGTVVQDLAASNIDSLIDTPTNYEADSGNNRGNYCTLNPLDSTLGTRLSDGNLQAVGNNNWAQGHTRGTFGLTSGKWYWEVTKIAGGAYAQIGFCNKAFDFSTVYGSLPADSWTLAFHNGTEILRPAGGGANYFSGSAMAVGDVLGIALDMDNKTAIFYKNGSAGASISLSSTKTSSTDNIDEIFPLVGVYSLTAAFNGGQRPFAYTPPTGYKSLCTQNLSDPTIADPSTAFDVALWSGTGSSQTISLGFDPDMIWSKTRNHAVDHKLVDSVRGFTKQVEPNRTIAEYTNSTGVTGTSSTGFTIGSSNDWNNSSSRTYVGWAWNAATTTVTNNTDGSITPTGLRANPSAGFSIVTYNGTGSNATFGHGLNAAPELVIVKSRSDAQNWAVQHSALGPTYYGYLQSSNAFSTTSGGPFWNNTAPTSSVVNVGTDNDTNASGKTYVAYCFTPVEGYSAMGSYSSGSDPFVFTGFSPRFVLLKKTNAAGHWYMFDSERGPINLNESWLEANGSGGEQTHANGAIQFLSNGFQPIGSDIDASSCSYIYYAVAENPFNTARAR